MKIKVLFDANIILKLRDSDFNHSASEDPRVLMADWLVDETLYYYAPEMYNEIDRDCNKDRAAKIRKFLANFEIARCDIEKLKYVERSLRSIIIGKSENDTSDRKQLAACISSDINYFITLDAGIFKHREEIEEVYNIQIFTPHEFILKIDELLHKDDYAPSLLKSVATYVNSKMSAQDISRCIDAFLYNGENRKELKDVIHNAITHNYNNKIVKDKDGKVVAICVYHLDVTTVFVDILRIVNIAIKPTLYMQLVADILNSGINEGAKSLEIRDFNLEIELISVLSKFGFIKVDSKWVKHMFTEVISKDDVEGFLKTQEIQLGYTPTSVDDFMKIEHQFYPLKIWDIDVPCYIIPIKPYWAGQLFDYNISGSSLFGAEETKLWNIENVYFRSTRPITEIAPARILWYASADKNIQRKSSIVATSYLDEVLSDKPKELFRNNKHYGIYEWNNIHDLCKGDIGKNIRLLRFSKTEVFNHPIKLPTVQKILGNKNTFASPMIVGMDIFDKIYKLGKWKK